MDEKKTTKNKDLDDSIQLLPCSGFSFFPPALAFSPTCASRRNAVALSCSMRHLSLG